jgi:hypothetical protein
MTADEGEVAFGAIIPGMNGLPPLGALRRNAATAWLDLRQSRFLRDRLSLGLLLVGLGVNLASLLWLSFVVRPNETQVVPTQYSNLASFSGQASWFYPYTVALYALAVTLVNGVFAYRAFGRSRLASFFLLSTSVVVGLFSLIIANAFGAIR